jgi:hypothetical protein
MAAFVASSADILDLDLSESSQRGERRGPSRRRTVGECSALEGITGATKRGELPVVSIAYQRQSDRQIAERGMVAWQRDDLNEFYRG